MRNQQLLFCDLFQQIGGVGIHFFQEYPGCLRVRLLKSTFGKVNDHAGRHLAMFKAFQNLVDR